MSELFKQYPNMSEYFETSDGEKFFKEDPAKVHGRTLKNKTVKTVTRPEAEDVIINPATKPGGETVKQIIAKLPEMDLETAKKYLDEENELETPRKTVTDALEKRIKELEIPVE